ncbi:glycosyltransferase family 24 protein [Phlebopus sp. FC_14]|nr:glycosyltransferase family 24 protein [Phlebopus sp. FC_14]
MPLPYVLFTLTCAVLCALAAHGATPPVTVSLRSSFTASDPLIEAIETIAMEDSAVLFPLLSSFPLQEKPRTPRDAHRAVFDVASAYMGRSAVRSAEALLALHAAGPRLAASAEYYDIHISNLSDSNKPLNETCASWVDWYGQVICDAETLLRLANEKVTQAPVAKTKRLPVDHVHKLPPSIDAPLYTAIHFADPTAPSFASLHSTLLSLEPKVEYVFRWAKGTNQRDEGELSSYLSGYGVALDLKKMDYLVLDDRNQPGNGQGGPAHVDTTSRRNKGGEEDLASMEEALTCVFDSLPYIDGRAETRAKAGEPLSSEEIADLGLKAVQFITSFSDQPRKGSLYIHSCWHNHHITPPSFLVLFRALSNSFPLYAASLARKIRIRDDLRDEVYENWAKAAPGVNMAWVNGRLINENDGASASMFGILRTLQRERGLVKSLVGLGLTQEQAVEFLMHPAHSANFLDGLVDSSDRQEGGSVVLWCNDLQNDQRYALYSSSLHGLLRTHMMSLFSPLLQIRLNLMNIVFVLDLSQTRSLQLLGSLNDNFVKRGFPVRWGFVPECDGEGKAPSMARLVYYIQQKYGRDRMEGFIQEISASHFDLGLTSLSWQIVHQSFNSFHAEDSFAAVAGGDIPVIDEISGEDILARAQKYTRRLGVAASGEAGKGHVFVNGRYFPVNDNLIRQIGTEATRQFQVLQEMVYIGEITDSDANLMSNFFYDLPSTMSRRNAYIFAKSPSGNGHALEGPSVEKFNMAELFANAGAEQNGGSFVVPSGSDVLPITMYVIADLDSLQGLQLAKEALMFVSNPVRSRLAFLHNPDTMTTGPLFTLLSTLAHRGQLSDVPPSRLLEALDDRLNETTRKLLGCKDVDDADVVGLLQTSLIITRQLGIQPGQRAILVNGRLIGPLDSAAEFIAEDFEMLEEFEMKQRVGRVAEAINAVLQGGDALDSPRHANLVSMASSIVYADQQPDSSEAGLFDTPPRPRTCNYRLLSGDYIKFEFGDKSTAQSHVALLMDPLSEPAQRWSTILERHLDLFPGLFFELYFNPTQYSEIPLKRFYRYNVVPGLRYDANGQEVPAQVKFSGLPVEPIYTLAMDVPPSWLVRPREALYDLDNIQLGRLPSEEKATGVQALFALDYLVVEGHVRELKASSPPRGVQLQLVGSKDLSTVDDTQVVANLGYLQFKARPGAFRLEIREGRGRDIYRLESVGSEGWNSPTVADTGNEFAVMSFDGLTLYPRLARNPGMETMDVLDRLRLSEQESPSIMESFVSRMASLFNSRNDSADAQAVIKQGDRQADINIFTVASGLLYERFASIMILSVLRNTKSSVKFWFIENFLSPSFLEFIPHMAKEHSFQYELVTYKWPSWLRAQKEKQRIIWAYKILFLDVLFPMDLKKVIFVDADQIVRADLQELVDLDLHGAPYGYTPMGDDNYEMEGFRFWKTGYWHEFLNGRPYHISALYVVDLVRFREMAAGDILRSSYQMLSADPNSLANLDQVKDLPNNLQREVPIYSLHEDWLWCETWCNKDRLHRAKTIDLCQNPLTKEPKLSRARQIPEWEVYDAEIAQFARRLAAEGKIRGGVATADSNFLASGNTPSVGVFANATNADVSPSHDEL